MDNILFERIKELRSDGLSITKISRFVNKCTDTVREYLVLLNELPEIPKGGGRNRKYIVNDLFFEKIDTEAKAYVLGFLFADGCIHPKRNRFSITLKSSDELLLIKINELLKSNFPIKHYSARYNENYKHTDKSSLQITSKKILEDLEKIGCTSKKSDKITFPTIDNEYVHHFMRGYFDGDGTVYITNKNEIMFGIISTIEFCDIYLKKLPYNGKTKPIKDYRSIKNVYNLKIGGKNQVETIFNFLYKDATIFLKRKKDKFDEFFKERESN